MAVADNVSSDQHSGDGITKDFVIGFCLKLYETTRAKAVAVLDSFKERLDTIVERAETPDEMIAKVAAQCRALRLEDDCSVAAEVLREDLKLSDEMRLRELLKSIQESPYGGYLKRTQASLKRDMIYFYKLLTSHTAELLKKISAFDSSVCDEKLVRKSCLVKIDEAWHPAVIVSTDDSELFRVTLSCLNDRSVVEVPGDRIAWVDREANVGDRAVVRTMRTGNFDVGCVAETPSLRNSFRYLIFFDLQFSEYCRPLNVHMLMQQASKIRSPTVNDEYSHFVSQYISNYPERPMVRLPRGSTVALLRQNLGCRVKEWGQAEIIRLDCSMMLVKHQGTGELEWLYRGSPRLLPIFRLYFKRQRSHASQRPNHDPTFVVFDEQKQPTARKSGSQKRRTTLTPSGVLSYCPKGDGGGGIGTESSSRGQRVRLTVENVQTVPNYIPHTCGRKCTPSRPLYKVSNRSRLLEPLSFGWLRQLKTCSDGSTVVEYRAPCGRSLFSIDQVDKYLYKTDSPLPIDRFCFDSRVRTDVQFRCVPEWPKFLKSADITQGKERLPVPCINQLDDEEPDVIDYQPERLPLNGIPMNTDPQFLEGCECEDNCRDKSKCSCWQKTMEGINTIRAAGVTNVPDGYRHRQLPTCIRSGVFECNVRCACDSRCCNRVVQNGLSVELQLFKTINKGWGLRTLCDLPEGSFICTYAGHILTDVHADERDYCDQYFADMDFIEVLEEMKDVKGPTYREMLGDLEMYILDGKICGNIGRYLNHSCMPNLYVQNVMVDTYDMRFPWIAFFTNRVVRAGEELCWDYRYDVDSVPGRKVMCRCGTRKCRGRLL